MPLSTLETKLDKWIAEGVPQDSGGSEGGDQIEEKILVQFEKETLESGQFVEAVLFQLYFEEWITEDDWDKTQEEVERILKIKAESFQDVKEEL